jgi:hypothetical protein
MRQKVKVKVRTRVRQHKERDSLIPIASPTLLIFLAVGAALALLIVYVLVKYLTHMGGVSQAI